MTDRAFLRALAADATLSAGEIGRRLGLSQPAAWRRVRRLDEAKASSPGAGSRSTATSWALASRCSLG
jgi:hypothetical protein